MKQIVAKTGLKATTVNRYKGEFPEYILHRMNGQLLEFSAESMPILRYIYELYQDRSQGRRTTERVRDILAKEYGAGQPPVIDVNLPATPSQDSNQITAIINFFEEQSRRLAALEEEQRQAKTRDMEILEQNTEILKNQLEIKAAVNERLALISEVAAAKRDEKQRGFWRRMFS